MDRQNGGRNPEPPRKPSNNLKFGRNLFLILIAFVVAISIFNFVRIGSQVEEEQVTYTRFLDLVERGQIEKVTLTGQTVKATATGGARIRTYAPEDPDLIAVLRKNNVDIEAHPETTGWWTSIIGGVLPIVIFVAIWFYIFRQMRMTGNRALSFGKSRARLATREKDLITFADVAAADEAKEELQEVIEFLKHPDKFNRMGAKIPKGVILVGPPGCGKTLLARAVAGEAGVSFFSISGSDFVEMFVGVGASRVRDLFEQGRKNAPCIVFIDELDAVGRQRFAGIGGGHDEKEQTLNQLLVELDGFNPREGVIIMGATNRPDVLDAALLRPGRFDRKISIGVPDIKGREAILRLHMRDHPIASDVDAAVLARQTPGFVGSDLANLVNEATLLAGRRDKNEVTMGELEEAIDRVIAGPEKKSRVIGEKEKKIVAYHESGHTLVGNALPLADPIHKVSIIPRGSAALGYTLQLPLEDRYLATKSELLEKLTVLLAGRAAEEMIFGEVSTGAHNDLQQATHMARKMVVEYGMSSKLGPVVLTDGSDQVFLGRDLLRERNYSDKMAFEVDKEIQSMVEECHRRAFAILREHKSQLIALADMLAEREVLGKEEIESVLGKKAGDQESPASETEEKKAGTGESGPASVGTAGAHRSGNEDSLPSERGDSDGP